MIWPPWRIAAMPYYPETTVIKRLAHIIRDRRLPARSDAAPVAYRRRDECGSGQRGAGRRYSARLPDYRRGRRAQTHAIPDAPDEFDLRSKTGSASSSGRNSRGAARDGAAKCCWPRQMGMIVRIENGRIVLQISERVDRSPGENSRRDRKSRVASGPDRGQRRDDPVRLGQRRVLLRSIPFFAGRWFRRR